MAFFGAPSAPAGPFVPLYGEPAWSSRPENSQGKPDLFMFISNFSYEENRLMAMNKEDASNLDVSGLAINKTSTRRPLPAASSTLRQKTYLKWYQSPQIEILVGPTEGSFKLPSDFLARRSRLFSVMVGSKFIEADTRVVRLPETDPSTFEQVLIWSMSPEPTLSTELSLSATVDIAIFATIYIMPALLNQAFDLLLLHIRGYSVWTPDVVGRIYRHTEADSPLRRFVRATLPLIDQPVGVARLSAKFQAWQSAFEENSELGYDYFIMKQSRWTVTNLITCGSCWFHQHAQGLSKITDKPYSTPICKTLQSIECFEDVDVTNPRTAVQDLVDQVRASKLEVAISGTTRNSAA